MNKKRYEEIENIEEAEKIEEHVDNKKGKKKKTSIGRILKCLLVVVGICGVLFGGFVVFHNYIGIITSCQSKCMEPNIKQGKTFFASRLVKAKNIKRNDVIIFEKEKTPGAYYVRRVIGLPGEKVEMKKGYIYINGKKIKDPYRGAKGTLGIMGKDSIKLGKNEFFVLCDDRTNLDDSRMKEMGAVKAKEIIAVKKVK